MAGPNIDFKKAGDQLTLHARERLDRKTVSALWPESKNRIKQAGARQVALDLGEVSGLDSAGVAYLRSVENFCRQEGIKYEEQNIPEGIKEFLRYTRERAGARHKEEAPAPPPGFIASIGLKSQEKARGLHYWIEFFGRLVIAMTERILHPREFHVREILYQVQLTGVGAVPLIVALCLLLGILIVFQQSGKVSMFGSNILVADVVIMAVTREMAPLVVAVVIAGRSGSAFAAEIGAMKVNDELDALTVMNLDVLRMIVLPRVWALAIAEPVLTMIGDLAGIVAGCFTAEIFMGVSIPAFIHEARGALSPADFYTGLIKSVPFGIMTGYIGCTSGLRAARGPDSIGIQTTAAVVKSIFSVILIDTVASYIFTLYGW